MDYLRISDLHRSERFNAYGMELTGAEPKHDLIENATPNVIRYRPKI